MRNSLVIALFTSFLFSLCSAEEACARIFISGMNSYSLPYGYMFEGDFSMTGQYNGQFPVYTHETKTIHMLTTVDSKFVVFTESSDAQGYLAFSTKPSFNPKTWQPASGDSPFANVIDRWIYFDPALNTYVPVDGYLDIKCVPAYRHQCPDNSLYFVSDNQDKINDNPVFVGNSTDRTFKQYDGIYRNNRTVYKAIIQEKETFLYYSEYGSWFVGYSYDNSDPFLKVYDAAYRPEYITGEWRMKNDATGYWYRLKNTHLECSGKIANVLSNHTNCTTHNPCQNYAACLDDDYGDSFCLCRLGYEGILCENQLPMCPPPKVDSVTVVTSGALESQTDGNIVIQFCPKNYQPHYYEGVYIASGSNPYWEYSGTKCTRIPTTTTTTTTTTTSMGLQYYTTKGPLIDFEEPLWLSVTVIFIAGFGQVFSPFWLYSLMKRWANRKNEKAEKQLEAKLKVHQETLDQINARKATLIEKYPSFVFNFETKQMSAQSVQYTTEMWNAAMREYTELAEHIEVEQRKAKALAQPEKTYTATMTRAFSLAFFFSFWLWILYEGFCYGVQCERFGVGSDTLRIMGFVAIAICYVWMLCESCMSNEWEYLSSLGQSGSIASYLNKIRNTQPVIFMHVESYHYETRTRTVYRRDANGNTTTGLETYRVPVVTASEDRIFEYSYWQDTSAENIEGVRQDGVTKIKIEKDVEFGDTATKDEFLRQYEELQAAYRNKDVYFHRSVDYHIRDFKPRLATYFNKANVPCWLRYKALYWVLTILALAWIYRWVFRMFTSSVTYLLTKKIYMNNPSSNQDNNRLTRYDPQNLDMVRKQIDEIGQAFAEVGQDVSTTDTSGSRSQVEDSEFKVIDIHYSKNVKPKPKILITIFGLIVIYRVKKDLMKPGMEDLQQLFSVIYDSH